MKHASVLPRFFQMTCDIPSLFLCLNRLPEKVPFLPVSVTEHFLFSALFRLGFLCGSEPHFPAAPACRGPCPRSSASAGDQGHRPPHRLCVQKQLPGYMAHCPLYSLQIGNLGASMNFLKFYLTFCVTCVRGVGAQLFLKGLGPQKHGGKVGADSQISSSSTNTTIFSLKKYQ